MDAVLEARAIQKEIQEHKKEIILLEKDLKKNKFEESFQSKLKMQDDLREEMGNLNEELQQLRQDAFKIKSSYEIAERSEIETLKQKIEALKKENYHLIAQDEQLKKSDQLLDINQQNCIYGLYQRKLGPLERENSELLKKIKKSEEAIEKLREKCEKVKKRYPASCVERLKVVQDKFNETIERENALKHQAAGLEEEIKGLKSIPKQNPSQVLAAIAEISSQIDKDKAKFTNLERKIKEKSQELRIAKLTVPKSNGSHTLYKELELLSCILMDKMNEIASVTRDIENITINNST
jgi:DNA repair exonuclease SbcCD ATPase subunit